MKRFRILERLAQYQEFRRLHFGTFMVGIYLGLFSAATALVIALATYLGFLERPIKGQVFVGGAVAFSVIQTFFAGMLVNGRLIGVWGNTALFLMCLFAILPAFFYSPERWSFLFGIASSLAGIFWVNSARYATMCQMLRTIHRQRMEAMVELKASRKTPGKSEVLRTCRRKNRKPRF